MAAKGNEPDEFGDNAFDDSDEFGDDAFDGVDDADLEELEQLEHPSKRTKLSRDAESPDSQDRAHLALAERLLSEKFGYKAFRHEQAGAIQKILAGQNTLVIFPTGAGKSLCYQIPAIAFPELDETSGLREPENAGVTIVVSPLIALMKDQVDALRKRGIAADSIDSTKSWDDVKLIHDSLRKSLLRILYCAPERLNNEGFIESVKNIPGGIRLLAVDEAHCISEWGHSFRPDYLKVARFVDEVKAERVICLTATATPKVAQDVCKAFKISPSCVFQTSPYRPNLELNAKTVAGSASDAESILDVMFGKVKTECDLRFAELFKFLRANPGPTLVYVALQQQAENHAEALQKAGFNAAAFHAGMKTEVKQKIQDDFMDSKIQIVCATIAFGMGIDKADIRNVVHWDLSNTIEEYSQQIGRAGRDGLKSRCMFYLSPSAFYLREVFARRDLPSRQSLRGLLVDIFNIGSDFSVGQAFKVSHYKQGREFDIGASPLAIIYATLELHFGLFRAVTPEYSSYKFEAMKSYFPVIKKDPSPEAKAIFSGAKKKVKYHDIDVNAVARSSGLGRMDIVKKLNFLSDSGHIKLQVAGIEQRYLIQKKLPQTDAEIDAVLDKLYTDMETREEDALQRSREVMALITGRKCFALALAQHFGMGLPNGKSKCGHCTFCLTGVPVMAPPRPITRTTAAAIQGVLKATDVRDDPRFLTRVAFGISSPRLSQLGLMRLSAFRSLAHHDFEALLREFTKACDAANRKS
ncbi:P-loop containing nucleoside triphosphate hydrolase protein [Lasiosphaeria ovina]|uniref:DNA 3'-5' helicase n=1 Tax=Lasiosphaeria ovina TaxID=92902 RepID=A0AAE0N8J1_9PEZI|nr:P-loop containing nucleoside triphosphate hydrolase protein [Lasiosphaeria ovina]